MAKKHAAGKEYGRFAVVSAGGNVTLAMVGCGPCCRICQSPSRIMPAYGKKNPYGKHFYQELSIQIGLRYYYLSMGVARQLFSGRSLRTVSPARHISLSRSAFSSASSFTR